MFVGDDDQAIVSNEREKGTATGISELSKKKKQRERERESRYCWGFHHERGYYGEIIG